MGREGGGGALGGGGEGGGAVDRLEVVDSFEKSGSQIGRRTNKEREVKPYSKKTSWLSHNYINVFKVKVT